MKLFMTRNIGVVKLLQENFSVAIPVFNRLHVCSSSKAFITVCLCLGCVIALYGVSVLYCDMRCCV